MAALTLILADPEALRTLYEEHLSKRRAFVPGAGDVAPFTPCELVLVQGERSYLLATEIVYVRTEEPGCGVGLSLSSLDAVKMQELRAFAYESVGEVAVEVVAPSQAIEASAGDETEAPVDERESNVLERIRSLSSPQQQRLAANGTLSERIALERIYGPNVWETLLRNTRITMPEVARIARKGTLPRPLVESIAANASWIATGEVQRALLSNPRASSAVVGKVLRAMPRGDLARVPEQTAYPMTVRAAAKKLLQG